MGAEFIIKILRLGVKAPRLFRLGLWRHPHGIRPIDRPSDFC